MQFTINTAHSSPNHFPRLAGDPIDLIVLHATVGDFEGAVSWLSNPASEVSAHYVVSQHGEIENLVNERDQAWHAGTSFWRGRTDLNRYSIGIEMENRTGQNGFAGEDPWPEVQYQAAAWLVDAIC